MSKTYKNIRTKIAVQPKTDCLKIKTIDLHTGGEPLRVIVDGFPELKGNSVLEYRRYCKENFDELRTALLFEPRGHADMYACILLPPNDDQADFGIVFTFAIKSKLTILQLVQRVPLLSAISRLETSI